MENSAEKTRKQKTIKLRQKKQQEILLEKFRDTHIVGSACKKACISRAAYYRWREDKDFARQADEALREGKENMNDLAESQLMRKISEGDMQGIKFYLTHNHTTYRYDPSLIASMEKHKEIDEIRHSWKYIIAETKSINNIKNENKQLKEKIVNLKSLRNKSKNRAVEGNLGG